jgi:ribosomal protein S18 acetylase RimI-like enzyme
MLIRSAAPTDRGSVEEALTASRAFSDDELRVALELFDEGSSGGYWLFVAEIDTRVQGYVCLGQAALTQSSWYLYWICVHPCAQHHGVGRALQRHAETVVRAHGGRRLVLETSGRRDYDRARQFYQMAGYGQVGRIQDFYRDGDDCVIYVKPLVTNET